MPASVQADGEAGAAGRDRDGSEGGVEGLTAGRWSVEDHVSLADRLAALRWSRATVAIGTLLGVGLVTERPVTKVLLAGGLFAIVFCLDLLAKLRLDRGVRPTNRMLVTAVLVEGLAIVTALYLAGGNSSPVRYAVVIHAATTALLLSRQIAVRSTVWVSLLLLVSNEMQELGLITAVDAVDGSRLTTGPELGGLLIAVWVATLLTASASAINERVLLRERLDQHIHASFGQAAEAARAPAETARVLAEHVLRTGDIRQVVVVDTRDEPVVLAHKGEGEEREAVLTAPPGSLLHEVVTKRTNVHAKDLAGEPDADLRDLLDDPRNVSAVPMVAGDDVLGVLLVVHGTQIGPGLQRNTVENYKRLAGHAALALANAWATETLDRQARTDGLTGVANRHTFDEQFEKELSRARRERSPLSLVLCDVDHFKRFNDEHGHQVGDRVLADVAQTLERERRPYDLVARYGGEEFVVILSQADFDEAMRVAERLRRAVEDISGDLGVTASFGVASASDGMASRSDLISTADACLYAAKEHGRNRVEGAQTQLFTRSTAEQH